MSKIKLSIKGWTYSGKPPLDSVSEDGNSVMFGGLQWFPELDFCKLYVQPTHFGRKKRGRYPNDSEKFDGKVMKMEDFVKSDLSRRGYLCLRQSL